MNKYNFKFLDKKKTKEIIPIIFDILYENMSKITIFKGKYEIEKAKFLACISPAMLKEKRQIVLFYDKDFLIGYAQYFVNNQVFRVEEIQIISKYQRTMLLYQFCKFIKTVIPKDTLYIEAYAHKLNTNSQALIKSVGMKLIDEDKESNTYHYKGYYRYLYERF